MRIVKAAPVMAKVRDDIDQVFDRLFRTTFAPEALLRTSAPAPEAWNRYSEPGSEAVSVIAARARTVPSARSTGAPV